jgi:hypothetical protein
MGRNVNRRTSTLPFHSWRRWLLSGLALSALLLSLSGRAAAQGGGLSVIQGNVFDAATKQPMADVVITVTSPALQGEQVVVTDGTGFYRVPSLPSGLYQVRAEKDTYRPYSRLEVQLRSDIALRINVELLPETLRAEEVTVVGRPPTIDVGSSSISTTVSNEMARRVPIARPTGKGAGVRSYESVAKVAPEAKDDDFGVSVAGTTSPENRYIIEGLAVNNTAYGIGSTPLSMEFVKEVNVVTGGYMPEYGRATGGVLNVVTKTGSNELHSSGWFTYTPGWSEGPAKSVVRAGSTVQGERPKVDVIADGGADIGLPIIKDRLWFYGGFQLSTTHYKDTRTFWKTEVDAAGKPQMDAAGNQIRTQIPGTSQTVPESASAQQYILNLTGAPNQSNRLSYTMVFAPYRSGGVGKFGVDSQTGAPEIGAAFVSDLQALGHQFKSDTMDHILKWTLSSPNKRVVVDTTAGWHHEIYDAIPWDGSEPGSSSGLAGISAVSFRRTRPGLHPITDFVGNIPPGYCEPAGSPMAVMCPVTNWTTLAPGYIATSSFNRLQLRSVATIIAQGLGHHVIKAGFDMEMNEYNITKAYTGGNFFRESTGGTSWSDLRNYGYLTGPDQAVLLEKRLSDTKSWGLGGFAQDSWAVMDKVTVNVGLRYDAQLIYNTRGDLGLTLPNQVSPRLGFIWDPTYSGRAKVFGSYAKYFESVPLDLSDRALSGESGVSAVHDAKTCDPTNVSMQRTTCRDPGGLVTQGDPSDPNQKRVVVNGGATPVDPDIRPQATSEIVLGAEYQLIADSRVGVSYTKRWLNEVIEDMSRDEGTTVFLGNPGSGIASDFPKAKRNYDALTVYFSRNFYKNWLAQASYTLSFLKGNYAGLYRPETLQLDPNINSDFDLQSLLPNRDGWLPGDRRHQIKIFGAHDLALTPRNHLLTSAGLRGSSGEPANYLGSHALYGLDEVYLLPRGSGERLPWQFDADVSLGYSFAYGRGQTIDISMDVFNLFNFQAGTVRSERYTSAEVLPLTGGKPSDLGTNTMDTKVKTPDGSQFDPAKDKNPNFGNITAYQPPRIFRFSVRVNY